MKTIEITQTSEHKEDYKCGDVFIQLDGKWIGVLASCGNAYAVVSIGDDGNTYNGVRNTIDEAVSDLKLFHGEIVITQ